MLSTLQIHYITTLKCMKNKRTYLSNFGITAFFSVYAKAKDDKIYIYIHMYVHICMYICMYICKTLINLFFIVFFIYLFNFLWHWGSNLELHDY
jgi:hypothetical protein